MPRSSPGRIGRPSACQGISASATIGIVSGRRCFGVSPTPLISAASRDLVNLGFAY
jgi:hypothetical protein